MDTRRKIEIFLLIIFILFVIPMYIIGLPFQLAGHLLASIGYLFWGDTYTAKKVWLNLFQEISRIWNGR